MKVLQLCLSGGTGGLELYPVKVLKWQKDKGMSFHTIVPSNSFIADKLEKESIPYSTLKRWSEYLPLLSAFRLACLIDKLNIDIIHMHHRVDLVIAVLAKCLARRTVKLVYTRHMGMSRSKKDIYHSLLYCSVDCFVAITKAIYEQAKSNLPVPVERIDQLYYGVPAAPEVLDASCNELYTERGLHKERFKIGLFGRLDTGKGHDVLVKAIQKLRNKGMDVEAVFVGQIMNEDYFESVMNDVRKAGLLGHIHHYGFHPRPMEIMGCFDVVVLASYQEAFGLVLVEAMRCGTAVIGSNVGGVPEIIKDGETGLLFETRNADSLAEAIEKFMTDPELLARLAKDGKTYADENFSEEKHFRELERIYRSVLSDTKKKI